MLRQLLLISFFALTIFNASGQTDFITISAQGIGWTKQQDNRHYSNEIKIDIKSGDVYFRKNTSKNFKLVERLKNDTTVLYFKNAVTYNKLDSLVKRNTYKVEVRFKVEFIHHGKSISLPDPTFTHILEFGYPLNEEKELAMIRAGWYDHGYSFVEIFKFDKRGYKISKVEYPISQYLSKEDSIMCDQRRVDFVYSGDSLIVSKYLKDTVWEKTVYKNNISYRIHKEAVTTNLYDSLTKIHSSKLLGYDLVPTIYSFNDDDKIYRIKCNSGYKYYDMTFHYPNTNKIIINCSFRNWALDSIENYQNTILKNKQGQMIASTFCYAGKPEDFSSYSLIYDKHNNLSKITRRTKAKDWFDNKENLYVFTHTYKEDKLSKTIVHYNFGTVNNNVVYFYNNKGLVNEIDVGGYKIFYHYNQD